MKKIHNHIQVLHRGMLAIVLAVLLLAASGFTALTQPSNAGYPGEKLNTEEQIDRAYDGFGQDAGREEEIYRQRLNEGQNPEKMPKPFKRIPSVEDKNKEVPQTSGLETAVSKVRGAIDSATGK